MRPTTREALSEENPHDFLNTLESGFSYTAPDDFPQLSKEGKMTVALRCFAQCFASGGYAQTIAELYAWYPEIAAFLVEIGAEPFATEVQRILTLAEGRGLNVRQEDDAIILEEFEDYHRAATLRDLPHADLVSHCMRRFVENHPDVF